MLRSIRLKLQNMFILPLNERNVQILVHLSFSDTSWQEELKEKADL